MVGEEQQRVDEPTKVMVCRVNLGTYNPGVHYGTAVLPFKRVLRVLGVNLSVDTYYVAPIRVVSPNIFRYHARAIVTNAEAGGVAIGVAEVACEVPYD